MEDSSPFYQKLKPDTDGGLTFKTVNLRFVAVKRSHIEVYNARTGERLLTLDEQKARAEVAEQQREAEAAAHLETKQKNQVLEAEVSIPVPKGRAFVSSTERCNGLLGSSETMGALTNTPLPRY